MAERDGLENRCTLTGTEGSNPSLSATETRKPQQVPSFSCLYVALLLKNGSVDNYWGLILHCCRIVNGIKNKNLKNSLGATWNASHLAVRLCALRHWKRVSMPPTTQSLRHLLTKAHHIAPRIKTARRFTAKNP